MATDAKFEIKCGGPAVVRLHNPDGTRLALPENSAVTLHDLPDGFYGISASGTVWLADKLFRASLSTPKMDEPLVFEREANASGILTAYVDFELSGGVVS